MNAMSDALVRVPVCALRCGPDDRAEQADEVLSGMAVTVLDHAGGWCQVETPYRYRGWARAGDLCQDGTACRRWAEAPKRVVLRAFCDVLSGPGVEHVRIECLTRGALVSPLDPPEAGDWQRVRLCDGREGFVRMGFLGTYHTDPAFREEGPLRAALTETARSYLGTQYRWGGKTPLGIDCSGLTSMTYLLNGIQIFRDARIEPGFPVHPICRGSMGPGDLLFFPGHTAMYLGEGIYIHSTAREGAGVVLNSLDPASSRFRADLAGTVTAVGSIFGAKVGEQNE